MVYDGSRPGSGQWNCPFPQKWVERMKQAARACEWLTDEQVEAAMVRLDLRYVVPPGDFLSEPQDARGLPMSWCQEYEARHEGWPECCTAVCDFKSIHEVVVTNGEDDWPLVLHERVLTA